MVISGIHKCFLILVLFGLGSCKEEKIPSDITFTQKCDLSNRAKSLKNTRGTLHFTDSLPGLPLPEPIFIIFTTSKGLLPITVCNMPPEFQLAAGESKDVAFGGRIEVYSENVDAMSVPMELNYLKFE